MESKEEKIKRKEEFRKRLRYSMPLDGISEEASKMQLVSERPVAVHNRDSNIILCEDHTEFDLKSAMYQEEAQFTEVLDGQSVKQML